ncbi:hypothetical protein UACE39S_04489 [Ureibacillus acetophenoni]
MGFDNASSYQGLGISLKEYGLVWTINGLLIITLQPLVSPLLNRYEHKIKYQLVVGVVIMMSSFVVIQFAESFTIFAIAMIIITMGEILVWPAIPDRKPFISKRIGRHVSRGCDKLRFYRSNDWTIFWRRHGRPIQYGNITLGALRHIHHRNFRNIFFSFTI